MQTARIIATVANVWRQPQVTALDRLVLKNSGLDSWIEAMSDADSVAIEHDDRVVTQVLFNDPFVIDRIVDGWAYGYVTNQADPHHPHGYPGWVWAAQLSLAPLPLQTGPTVTVKRAVTPLLRPDGSTLRQLVLGTELPVVSGKDAHYDLVQTPLGVGKVAKRATQIMVHGHSQSSGGQLVALATNFLDLRYL